LGGTGADVLSGGVGSDVFGYGATTDGGAVSTNVSPTSVGVTGDTVSDFVSGTDKFTFLNSAFGNLSTGTLQSANFASINEAYKGEASQISNKSGPVFVFDSIDTLYYDPSTSQAGYTVISTTNLVNVRLATSKLSPHFSSNAFPFSIVSGSRTPYHDDDQDQDGYTIWRSSTIWTSIKQAGSVSREEPWSRSSYCRHRRLQSR
jgi:hypothetical protein